MFASARDDDWDIQDNRDLYTVAADGSAEPERLTEVEGACDLPSWSPDGTRITYLFYPGVEDPRHTQVAVLDLASGQRTLLTESLDRTCAHTPTGARRSGTGSGSCSPSRTPPTTCTRWRPTGRPSPSSAWWAVAG